MTDPNYSKYSMFELCQSLNSIVEERYPETYEALIENLEDRNAISRHELEECWFLVDKKRRPEFAKWLRKQIDAQGGFTAHLQVQKKEKPMKRSLWQRLRGVPSRYEADNPIAGKDET